MTDFQEKTHTGILTLCFHSRHLAFTGLVVIKGHRAQLCCKLKCRIVYVTECIPMAVSSCQSVLGWEVGVQTEEMRALLWTKQTYAVHSHKSQVTTYQVFGCQWASSFPLLAAELSVCRCCQFRDDPLCPKAHGTSNAKSLLYWIAPSLSLPCFLAIDQRLTRAIYIFLVFITLCLQRVTL